MDKNIVILSGGSDFLGRIFTAWYTGKDYEVVVISRRESVIPRARIVIWDARTQGAWCQQLNGALVLINLAGRLVNCRYNSRNRALIMNSRIELTRVLGEALAKCSAPPKV